MGLKSNEIDPLLIRQLKQTANKPVTRLVLLTQEGSQLQPVNKQIAQSFLNTKPREDESPGVCFVCLRFSQR